ncbi:MAG: gamma-butyrobetaine hydroxylase-like domain-containing protein, partial [Pseudohongiella sp.]|nr:gamma-butyrobetaine hydroxylase-like domain-containing protein [Pseudohongiella sp.]
MSQNEIARAPNAPQPTGIRLRRKSALLELTYADGKVFELPAEFLRVYSPSADVKG